MITSKKGNQSENEINLATDKSSILTIEEGVDIFRKRLPTLKTAEVEEAKKIARRFENMPVAIAQAAKYLKKSGEPINTYLDIFEKNKKDILRLGALQCANSAQNIDIYTSIYMTIKQLETISPEAVYLLKQCAYLPQSNIPKDLLKQLTTDSIKLQDLIDKLEPLVINIKDGYRIHTLIQDVAQDIAKEKNLESLILSDLGKLKISYETHIFLTQEPIKAKAIYLQGIEDERKRADCDQLKLGELLFCLGEVQNDLLEWDHALTSYKEALKIMRKNYGEKHPIAAVISNNIGCTLGNLKRHNESLECHLEALNIRKEQLGQKHLHVATSLNNIGQAFKALGNPEKALEYSMESLEMTKEILGENNPLFATGLNNIGLIFNELGKQKKALQYLMKSLKINKEILGENTPSVANNLNNIGTVYCNLGNDTEAIKYYIEALKIWEKDPDTIICLHNIGFSLTRSKKYKKALNYYKKALALTKNLFGDKHPDVADNLDLVGLALEDLEKYSEALEYYMQALALRKEVLGEKDISILKSFANIGSTLEDLEKYDEALEYYIKELFLTKELRGNKHPSVLDSLKDISETLKDLGKPEEAEKYRMKADELRQKLEQEAKSSELTS